MFRCLAACLICLAGFLLSACRENGFRDNAIVRRIGLKNTPDAVFSDLAKAEFDGDAGRLFALSTPRVRAMLRNEFRLTAPELSFEEALALYADTLREQNKGYSVTLVSLKEDADGAACTGICFASADGKKSRQFSCRIIRDGDGNWKNDSRL